MDRPKLIIITGPTAVGKSSLGQRLALVLGGEIINADSLQVYRWMDIGTAKPSLREREEVPYHLIDIINPDQPYDASTFRGQASKIIQELHQRQVPGLVVGGTGLYLRVLQRGLFPCPKPDRERREQWKEMASRQGPEFLWTEIQKKDPAAAKRIHPRDTFRLIRALEVLELTGRPLSQWQQWDQEGEPEFDLLWIALHCDREILYQRIDDRAEEMMAQGFLGEVEGLLRQGYSPELKALQSLGYRHLAGVIQGKWDLPTAVEWLKRDTRHYAKRQLTWLRGERNLNWFSQKEFDKVVAKVFDFLVTKE